MLRDRSLRRTALAVSMVSSFLTPFMASGINVAMPLIGKEFDLSAVTLGWVLTAYTLAAAMFLVPFGRLADLVGRKRIFALGIVVNIAGTVLGALAASGFALILARAVQGLGGAMIFGTGIAILTSVYPPGERGRALGLNTAAVYSGLSLGPVLGGFLVHAWGWRSVFWATVPIAALALVLTLVRLEGEWADARGEGFDLDGSAVFGAGLVALMYGFSRLPSLAGIALTAAGLLALAGFVDFELRAKHPLLDLRIFRHNRIFAFSNLAALFNYSATSAVAFLMSLYLQYIKGLPPQKAGLVLVAQPIVMALASPFAGTALGPHGAAAHRLRRHGPLGGRSPSLLLPRPRHGLRLHRREPRSASASASGSSPRPTRTRSCARSRGATSASPRPPSGPCA